MTEKEAIFNLPTITTEWVNAIFNSRPKPLARTRFMPIIPEAVIIRPPPGCGGYSGEIRPNHVFAWEPDLPHARELVIVTKITGDDRERLIWTVPIDGGDEVYNDESRFREACCATRFNPMAPLIRSATRTSP